MRMRIIFDFPQVVYTKGGSDRISQKQSYDSVRDSQGAGLAYLNWLLDAYQVGIIDPEYAVLLRREDMCSTS